MSIDDNPHSSIHKLLADSIPVGLFLCNPEGRVSGWTGSATNLTGWSDRDAIGRSFQALFRAAEDGDRAELTALGFSSAANYRKVGFARRADGTEFLAVFTMDRVTNEAGKVIGYACTLGPL
jgi:PAS domain S-box-containing protein